MSDLAPRVAALFVEPDGSYSRPEVDRFDRVDMWTEVDDARKYRGPWPAVCHPPCARWGRFWKGNPAIGGKRLGDDGGCFSHAIWVVRTCGGVIEHPAHSHAWRWFGLPSASPSGAWGDPDRWGGRTCAVDQGHYGHPCRKATWLYAVGAFPDFNWSRFQITASTKRVENQSRKQRMQTPPEFAERLIMLARRNPGLYQPRPVSPRRG